MENPMLEHTQTYVSYPVCARLWGPRLIKGPTWFEEGGQLGVQRHPVHLIRPTYTQIFWWEPSTQFFLVEPFGPPMFK